MYFVGAQETYETPEPATCENQSDGYKQLRVYNIQVLLVSYFQGTVASHDMTICWQQCCYKLDHCPLVN